MPEIGSHESKNASSSAAPRYHGFTCPNCGSHAFGTHTHFEVMGPAHPPGSRVGTCQAYLHEQSDCRFSWNRGDEQAEAQCMYTQTPEEWAASWQATREALSRVL